MYLVDTNVLSAAAPNKAVPQAALRDWMDRRSDALFLSAVTIAEVQSGIAKCRREGAQAKAGRLAGWLETMVHLYARRILPLDVPVARRTGTLWDQARAQGASPGLADLAIAATASVHGLVVLTRNLRHIEPLGVPAHDPFASLPDGL